jgi:hypothetical protein
VAATLAGAIKAHVESQGLGIAGFRDEVPEGQAFPYFVVREGIALTQEPTANAYSGDRAVIELVQLDLWMSKRNPANNAITENYTLPDAITAAVNGKSLVAAPKKVYGMKVVGRTRFVQRDVGIANTDAGLIRYAITVEVKRNL